MLENQADAILNNYSASELTAMDNRELLPFVPDGGMVRIISSDSHVLSTSSEDDDFENLHAVFSDDDDFAIQKTDGHKALIYHEPFPDDDHPHGMIEITQSLESLSENMSLLIMILAATTVLAIILSLVGGGLLTNLLLKPVTSMSRTMRDIQKSGEFKKIPLEKKSKDELGVMGETFNAMMSQLETNFEKQQQFLADASHELKTPITIVEGYTNMLKRWGAKNPDILQEAIEAIHHESQRMRDLIQQLLLVAKDDLDQGELNKERVDLVTLCQNMVKPLIRSHERGINIAAGSDQLVCTTDRGKLEQLLRILLDNAMKYSDKEIDLFIDRQDGMATITVADSGIGIPKEDLPRVFERFYRVDKSRQRKTGGSGLGLSIAQSIVTSLGGTIEVESNIGEGTRVTIAFPC
ncbi:signal transduction histidine kinase [Scopulibacillus darangshiensis]|uniref:histidine kinase n=2 Tax=Scopulibacillus darangshiensis TaxID=442528 RepID=A0A4R2NDG7_9BACL|nr:signal transduction histidine kinase [Scopulibacillus darangshiensis]